MKLEKITVKGFKSLFNVDFEPGNINVFIGANGAGKSTVLEAIGLLSAAMTDRVDANSLERKGVRLSTPALYKSSFESIRKPQIIGLSLQWRDADGLYEYDVDLNNPTDDSAWRYHSEIVTRNGVRLDGRSGRSNDPYDTHISLLLQSREAALAEVKKFAESFRNYAIYQPSTPILRGIISDRYQSDPIGLCGGRLAEAIEETIVEEDGDKKLGSLYLEEVLELVDWASDFSISAPKKSNISALVPTSRRVIEFQDRFMRSNDRFTAYDASEGSLYVLFLLCLAMHKKAPGVFAVDNFDQAMNPRLARATTKLFSNLICEQDKTVFLTTHNPLVLDGLDLNDPRIRLFTVERSESDGKARLQRIQVTEELLRMDQPLSRLWISGRLGGVPNIL